MYCVRSEVQLYSTYNTHPTEDRSVFLQRATPRPNQNKQLRPLSLHLVESRLPFGEIVAAE
jgi:hypothetical protein